MGELAENKSDTHRHHKEPIIRLSDTDQKARNGFFDKTYKTRFPVTEDEYQSKQHIVWYAKFLECRFRASWTTVTRAAWRKLSLRLMYRLIFGQDEASWKAFKKKLKTFEEHWDCSDIQSYYADPMLRTLCCSKYDSPHASKIYEEIDASDGVSPYYYPDSDFPFLGRCIFDPLDFCQRPKST
jgi:hypothetical protein